MGCVGLSDEEVHYLAVHYYDEDASKFKIHQQQSRGKPYYRILGNDSSVCCRFVVLNRIYGRNSLLVCFLQVFVNCDKRNDVNGIYKTYYNYRSGRIFSWDKRK